MPTVVIAGAQWGDEGKGKLVDCLTEDAHVVARYQGGHNAGHTVVTAEEQFILHLLPSGILHPNKLSLIGCGTVVDPKCLIEELDGLRKRGIVAGRNLMLSKGAHLIMPYHMAIERAEEARRGKSKIGTTLRGIGPAYTDKAARIGLKVADLLMPEVFKEKLSATLEIKNTLLEKLYGQEPFGLEAIFDEYMAYAQRLSIHIADTDLALDAALRDGKNILFEGAQGTLLDIDHGTYPFVTSSSSTAGGVCTGLGIGPTKIDKVIGVVKAYTTRVGEGPFPTELHGGVGDVLQERGGEFGATTGRPRRCGWLDIVALRHAVRANGLTGVAITKLDVLDGLEEVKVCTSYIVDGQRLDHFPKEAAIVAKCEPQYKTFPGWSGSTAGARELDALPAGARSYLNGVEDLIGVPIQMISTGPKRDELITIQKQF